MGVDGRYPGFTLALHREAIKRVIGESAANLKIRQPLGWCYGDSLILNQGAFA